MCSSTAWVRTGSSRRGPSSTLCSAALADIGIERAKPHVKRWQKQTSKIRPRRCEHGNSWESLIRENPIVETDAPEPSRMSSAEAQARVLASIAARAYSDEQTQHVPAYSYGRELSTRGGVHGRGWRRRRRGCGRDGRPWCAAGRRRRAPLPPGTPGPWRGASS